MIEIENKTAIASQRFRITKYLLIVVSVSPLLADYSHHVTEDFRKGIDNVYF